MKKMEKVRIIDTDSTNICDLGICSYKNIKNEGLQRKMEWMEEGFPKGLRIKTLFSEEHGNQGMIEYIPGEHSLRPVSAKDYMFIHCLFVGFKKEYKGKGYGSLMIKECIKDAKKEGMKGVAVVVRDGSFMAKKAVFLKNGFRVVDSAPPDFELLAKKFEKSASDPKFISDKDNRLKKYKKGLYILHSPQCPALAKSVKEISEVALNEYGIKPKIIELRSAEDVKENPNPFGTCAIIYNGKVVAHHPISKTRFKNIMIKELK
jgi:GNAT superfamily N-acetyltransferase